VPLSKADVAKALVVIKRFSGYLEVDEIAVESWHALLEPVIDDADVLREAILTTFREGPQEGESRELPARIIAAARETSGTVLEPTSPYRNITAELAAKALESGANPA
jgi:hypothetical protein